MKTVAEAIGVSRSNLAERRQERPQKRIGRPPLPDEELVAADQGGHRRAADLRLPACSRHPQAPGAGCGLKAAQSQAGLPGDEGPRPAARSPRRRCRAAA